MKLQSVLADISDERLHSLLAAVGLLNINLTKPFWKLVNSTVQYVDFHHYIKKMALSLECWINNPQLLLKSDCKGVFNGEFFEEGNVSLCISLTAPELVLECLRKILSSSLSLSTSCMTF